MKKTKKMYITVIIITLIYSICLFIGGLLIEKVSKLENDIRLRIENMIRAEQRNFLQSIIDKMEYDAKEKHLDINNIDDVTEWCKENYSYLERDKNNESFVIEVSSNKLIDSSLLNANSSGDYNFLDKFNLPKEEIDSLLYKFKTEKETDTDLHYAVDTMWLEWKTFPDNVFYNKNAEKTYVFISAIDSQKVLNNYDDTFSTINNIKIFIISMYTICLLSIIIIICNLAYKEFFKEK